MGRGRQVSPGGRWRRRRKLVDEGMCLQELLPKPVRLSLKLREDKTFINCRVEEERAGLDLGKGRCKRDS